MSEIAIYHQLSETMSHMRLKEWQKANTWSIKGPLLVVALLLGFFDHSLHWGGAAFAAGIAVVLPIIGFREFWSEWRFWAALSALALLQLWVYLRAQCTGCYGQGKRVDLGQGPGLEVLSRSHKLKQTWAHNLRSLIEGTLLGRFMRRRRPANLGSLRSGSSFGSIAIQVSQPERSS